MSDFDEKLNSLLSDPAAIGQIMQLAQSLSGSSDPVQPPAPTREPSVQTGPDFSLLLRFLPLLQAGGSESANARALLLALQPYLKEERRNKVEQALQLAHLICIGKAFLSTGEGGLNV